MVSFISSQVVANSVRLLEAARTTAMEQMAEDNSSRKGYWEDLFERNATAVLAAFPRVRLAEGYVVRYVFYGRHNHDLLVRPFVTRADTDVSVVRRNLDWHPPPDSLAPALRGRPTRDVELLYRHFDIDRNPESYFTYWIVMQELWASARWVYSEIIADCWQLKALLAQEGWRTYRPVERCSPAVILDDERGAELAVLMHCRAPAESVSLERLVIHADGSLEYRDPILTAHREKAPSN